MEENKLNNILNKDPKNAETKIDQIWFIDKFISATGKYPQQLTHLAVLKIVEDIYKQKDYHTENIFKIDNYKFPEYRYLLQRSRDAYNALQKK